MGINFKSLNQCLPYVTNTRKPVLIRGRHGIGKSQLIYQFAESIKMKVIERRASQMEPGDLLGLPKLTENGTEWILPDWVLECCNEPRVLFLDEVDRACSEVRMAIFELNDSRKIAGHTLHPDTIVIAATNGGDSASQYQVADLDPAELDRYTVFDVDPTAEDWLTWGKEILHPVVWDFINSNNNFLEHRADFEPGKVYPSRRSWHRFSDCIKSAGDDRFFEQEGVVSPTLLNLAIAFVGLEAAVSFGDHVKNFKFQVNPEDIIDKGEFDRVKNFQINDHLALVEKMSDLLKEGNKFSDKQLKHLATYFIMLPSEIAMKLFEKVAAGGVDFVKKFHKTSGVKDHLVKILTVAAAEKKNDKK